MRFAEKLEMALLRSCVCVGLDSVVEKLPSSIQKDPEGLLQFNKAIVDATYDLIGAYKPNFAFYEALGREGWSVLFETIGYIRKVTPQALIIADAKRGDIGNTSKMYAHSIFRELGADAVTINPYMGRDSVLPFVEDPQFGAFVLGLTSNAGSVDIQQISTDTGFVYEHVVRKALEWNKHDNIGLVVGATKDVDMRSIRMTAGKMPFLIPGIGAQGGNLESAVMLNFNGQYVDALINSSRSILYASSGPDFADAAKQATLNLVREIQEIKSRI